jgi:hypothetical protein
MATAGVMPDYTKPHPEHRFRRRLRTFAVVQPIGDAYIPQARQPGELPKGGTQLDGIRIPQRIVDGDFAGWLRAAMKSRRMSARMVGIRTGINHSTITRLLYGYRAPTLAITIRLLRLFGDDVTDQRSTNGGAAGAEAPESISSR